MFQDAEPAIPVKPNSSESLKQIAKCFKEKHLGHGGIVRLNASCFFSLRKTLLSTSSPAHWFSNKNNQPNPSPHHQKPKPNPTTCTISSLNPTDLEEMRGNLGFIGRKMSPNLIGGDSSQHICLFSSSFDKMKELTQRGQKLPVVSYESTSTSSVWIANAASILLFWDWEKGQTQDRWGKSLESGEWLQKRCRIQTWQVIHHLRLAICVSSFKYHPCMICLLVHTNTICVN